MKHSLTHVIEDFEEVGTRTIDERLRVTLGDIIKGFVRVKLLRGKHGDILLKPLVEIPASEAWLYKNKEALKSVKKGLEQAGQGKISKFNPNSL